jgi:hypothetical protein
MAMEISNATITMDAEHAVMAMIFLEWATL